MYIIDLLVGVPKTLSIHEYKYKYKYKYKSVQVAQVQVQDTTYKIQVYKKSRRGSEECMPVTL